MTEQDKIKLAKKYIDMLAHGFSPLDESPLGEKDIVRNIRVSRCLVYVSEILEQVIEKGIAGENNYKYPQNKKTKKAQFYLSAEERENFVFSESPLTVTEIANGLNELIDENTMDKIQPTVINEWLVGIGMLKVEADYNGKNKKGVTYDGYDLGIVTVDKISKNGISYNTIKFSKKAQQFIIDNLDAVIDLNKARKTLKKAEKKYRSENTKRNHWTYIQDELLKDLYSNRATLDDMCAFLEQNREFILQRLAFLGLN